MVANEFDCESALTVDDESVDSNEVTGLSDLSEWAGDGENTEPNTRLRPALRGTVDSILFRERRALWAVGDRELFGVDYEVNVLTRLSGLHPSPPTLEPPRASRTRWMCIDTCLLYTSPSPRD